MHGPGSGIELENEFAQLLTIERGLVVREREFFRWDDALRAAGLDPASLDVGGPAASRPTAGSAAQGS